MPKETLQQKVDRLNGYHVNEHDYLFDRLFTLLRDEIAKTDKQLVYVDKRYVIKDVTTLPDWIDVILQA